MENKQIKKNHSICIQNRLQGTLTGVEKVLNSNNSIIAMQTIEGLLIINGKELAITKFDSTDGDLIFEGKVTSIKYGEGSSGSLLKKIFK